jgi:hypothetical protein
MCGHPLRGSQNLAPWASKEKPVPGQERRYRSPPLGEGMGPMCRIYNSNPEGYVGPDLGNSTREGYRRCGRLSMMKDLVQSARNGSDLHMGRTAQVNYRLAAQSDLLEAVGSRIGAEAAFSSSIPDEMATEPPSLRSTLRSLGCMLRT